MGVRMRQNITSPIPELEVLVSENRGSEGVRDSRPSSISEVKKTAENMWRIYILASIRLLREGLGKLLAKRNDLQVVGQGAPTMETMHEVTECRADVLLLNSGGDVVNDLAVVRMVRMQAPRVRIMMLGMNDEPQEFLQCIRAGIAGYVFRDACSRRVPESGKEECRGGAFCEGSLCQL